jgi:hypothetical protein
MTAMRANSASPTLASKLLLQLATCAQIDLRTEAQNVSSRDQTLRMKVIDIDVMGDDHEMPTYLHFCCRHHPQIRAPVAVSTLDVHAREHWSALDPRTEHLQLYAVRSTANHALECEQEPGRAPLASSRRELALPMGRAILQPLAVEQESRAK